MASCTQFFEAPTDGALSRYEHYNQALQSMIWTVISLADNEYDSQYFV